MRDCRGTTAPFSTIFDMSGSVAEYTNESSWSEATHTTIYATRGGAWTSPQEQLECKSYGAGPILDFREDVGFRCCKDLP